MEKDYSVLTSIIWEFDKAVKFACTGFEALQYDLNNRRVQDLLDFSKPAQHVYVCGFFLKTRKHIVLFRGLRKMMECFRHIMNN